MSRHNNFISAGDPEFSAKPRTAPVGRCPLCGALGTHVLFQARDRLHGIPGEYTYKRCKTCRTVFQDPRIVNEDLGICYPGKYYTHAMQCPPSPATEPVAPGRALARARDALRRSIVAEVQGTHLPGASGWLGRLLASSSRLRERAFCNHVTDELLPRTPGALRALDVGCGSGALMAALNRVGWQVEGVEWDPAAANAARQASGQSVWTGDFRQIQLPLAAYGLIVLSHVFEHLDAPVPALRRIKELLAPAGRVVVRYPNSASFGARFFGGAWFPWEVPRHLVLPPGGALARAAVSVGLRPISLRTDSKHAAAYFAYSRAYKTGRRVIESGPDIGHSDRIICALERLLNRIASNLGEEVVLVLQNTTG